MHFLETASGAISRPAIYPEYDSQKATKPDTERNKLKLKDRIHVLEVFRGVQA